MKRTMKKWIDQDFLLNNETGKKLFFDFAKNMPIIDFHNHLNVADIAANRRYNNLTELWLEGDHYKWRAMRVLGIDEQYITGDAPDIEKFRAWARTVQRLPGNALYHWTHLELQRYFNINEPLTEENADEIFAKTKVMLAGAEYGAMGLLCRMNVEVLCTTDDPSSDLSVHRQINDREIGFQVLPTFRADRLICADLPGFAEYLRNFGAKFETKIDTFNDLFSALDRSIYYFKQHGCVASDHSLSNFEYTEENCGDEVLQMLLDEKTVTADQRVAYQSMVLRHLVKRYHENGFVMQLHLGAKRNNNKTLYKIIGADAGGDSVGDTTDINALSAFLSYAEAEEILPNTVLYCLNPGDNTPLATLAVSFAGGGVPGKVQFGSAWWFLDHHRGINGQLDEMIETGLLSTFIGMLTDSRSMTSFSRHEYFRRILCNKLGEIVESGEYAATGHVLEEMVEDICYWNAKKFFDL